MTLKEMLKELETHTGQVSTVVTERPAHTYKGTVADVRKHSEYQVRFGVKYGNQAVVKEKHESGEVQKTGLWNGWEEISPVAIRKIATGQVLLRAAPSRNTHSVKRASWLLNGKEVNKEEVDHLLTSKEKRESGGDWVYIHPENLQTLNGKEFRLDS